MSKKRDDYPRKGPPPTEIVMRRQAKLARRADRHVLVRHTVPIVGPDGIRHYYPSALWT